MAKKTYRLTPPIRMFNAFTKVGVRLGLAPNRLHLLTTTGRKTGRQHTTPISLVEMNGAQWVVAPYGERPWVRNVRAADGSAWLTRGRQRKQVKLMEVDAETAAPVLKTYMEREKIVQPYFDAAPGASAEALAAEADRHPVFRVEAAVATGETEQRSHQVSGQGRT